MFRHLRPAAFVLSALVPAVSMADTTMIYKEGAGQSMLRIADGKVRFDSHDDENYMLFDAATRQMTVVDPAKREYTVMDEAALDALQRTLDGMMAQVQAQMANLPPEMRAQMSQMMGGAMPGAGGKVSVTTEKTGRKGQAAGFACEYSRVLIDNEVRAESCLAPADELDLPSADVQAIHAWLAFVRTMAEKAGGHVDIDAGMFGDGAQIPLIYRNLDSRSEGVLEEVSHAAVDSASMRVPAGFRERKLEAPTR